MKLKECPFCGGKAELRDLGIGTGGCIVSCVCGVMMTAEAIKHYTEPDIHNEIKTNVIYNWNKRHLTS